MNIIEAAEQAGMTRRPADRHCRAPYWDVVIDPELERFAQIIRNQALEDAAKCCEHVTWEGCWKQAATNRAHAIRSMKKDQPCQ